jgi:ADP-heptose:LPS heptosyltransferase
MEPTVMRKIDYWLGMPLCFALTIWHKLKKLMGVQGSEGDERPRRVLFIELAEMGSTVVLYPAIQAFKRRYPEANLYFLLFENIKESLDITQVIDEQNVITIDSSSLSSLIRDTIKFIRLSRQVKIDTTINFEIFARYSTILSYLSGAKRRVGFYRYHQEGLYIGDFLSHKVMYNPHMHMSRTFLSLIYALQEPRDHTPLVKAKINQPYNVPKLSSSAKSRENIWQILKAENPDINENHKLIVVNPNASKLISIRKWPLDYYAKLVDRLIYDEDIYVAIIGVASEKPDADYICHAVKSERVLDLTGKTTLKELIDLFNIGDLLITNDSGPAHFAALTPIHTVVFFGPESPHIYRPLSDHCTVMYANYACSPCVSVYNQRLSSCNDNLCLQHIGVDDVYDVVQGILAQRTS